MYRFVLNLTAIRLHLVFAENAKSFLTSDFSSSAFRVGSSQTANIANFTLSTIRRHPFPLPLLADQHRIVEKVNELMAFCDQQEEVVGSVASARIRLLDVILTRLWMHR